MDKRAGVDIVNEVLEACIIAYPLSSFIISLYKQYVSRGWLTKSQLTGLYDKASRIETLAPGKLAALEAIIKKMPTRYKSEIPQTQAPVFQRDEETGRMIETVLEKYPQHKQVLFLKAKYENNESLSSTEMADLKRFLAIVQKAR